MATTPLEWAWTWGVVELYQAHPLECVAIALIIAALATINLLHQHDAAGAFNSARAEPHERAIVEERQYLNHKLNGSNDHTSVCFSGGGIRAAAYASGAAKAFYDTQRWSHLNYLSCVSGGGYLGSAAVLGEAYAAVGAPWMDTLLQRIHSSCGYIVNLDSGVAAMLFDTVRFFAVIGLSFGCNVLLAGCNLLWLSRALSIILRDSWINPQVPDSKSHPLFALLMSSLVCRFAMVLCGVSLFVKLVSACACKRGHAIARLSMFTLVGSILLLMLVTVSFIFCSDLWVRLVSHSLLPIFTCGVVLLLLVCTLTSNNLLHTHDFSPSSFWFPLGALMLQLSLLALCALLVAQFRSTPSSWWSTEQRWIADVCSVLGAFVLLLTNMYEPWSQVLARFYRSRLARAFYGEERNVFTDHWLGCSWRMLLRPIRLLLHAAGASWPTFVQLRRQMLDPTRGKPPIYMCNTLLNDVHQSKGQLASTMFSPFLITPFGAGCESTGYSKFPGDANDDCVFTKALALDVGMGASAAALAPSMGSSQKTTPGARFLFNFIGLHLGVAVPVIRARMAVHVMLSCGLLGLLASLLAQCQVFASNSWITGASDGLLGVSVLFFFLLAANGIFLSGSWVLHSHYIRILFQSFGHTSLLPDIGREAPQEAKAQVTPAIATAAPARLHTPPHLFLSDGGHFENLGLFPLLARRAPRLFVFDSGESALPLGVRRYNDLLHLFQLPMREWLDTSGHKTSIEITRVRAFSVQQLQLNKLTKQATITEQLRRTCIVDTSDLQFALTRIEAHNHPAKQVESNQGNMSRVVLIEFRYHTVGAPLKEDSPTHCMFYSKLQCTSLDQAVRDAPDGRSWCCIDFPNTPTHNQFISKHLFAKYAILGEQAAREAITLDQLMHHSDLLDYATMLPTMLPIAATATPGPLLRQQLHLFRSSVSKPCYRLQLATYGFIMSCIGAGLLMLGPTHPWLMTMCRLSLLANALGMIGFFLSMQHDLLRSWVQKRWSVRWLTIVNVVSVFLSWSMLALAVFIMYKFGSASVAVVGPGPSASVDFQPAHEAPNVFLPKLFSSNGTSSPLGVVGMASTLSAGLTISSDAIFNWACTAEQQPWEWKLLGARAAAERGISNTSQWIQHLATLSQSCQATHTSSASRASEGLILLVEAAPAMPSPPGPEQLDRKFVPTNEQRQIASFSFHRVRLAARYDHTLPCAISIILCAGLHMLALIAQPQASTCSKIMHASAAVLLYASFGQLLHLSLQCLACSFDSGITVPPLALGAVFTEASVLYLVTFSFAMFLARNSADAAAPRQTDKLLDAEYAVLRRWAQFPIFAATVLMVWCVSFCALQRSLTVPHFALPFGIHTSRTTDVMLFCGVYIVSGLFEFLPHGRWISLACLYGTLPVEWSATLTAAVAMPIYYISAWQSGILLEQNMPHLTLAHLRDGTLPTASLLSKLDPPAPMSGANQMLALITSSRPWTTTATLLRSRCSSVSQRITWEFKSALQKLRVTDAMPGQASESIVQDKSQRIARSGTSASPPTAAAAASASADAATDSKTSLSQPTVSEELLLPSIIMAIVLLIVWELFRQRRGKLSRHEQIVRRLKDEQVAIDAQAHVRPVKPAQLQGAVKPVSPVVRSSSAAPSGSGTSASPAKAVRQSARHKVK